MNWSERQYLQRCLLSNTQISSILDSSLDNDEYRQLQPLEQFLELDEVRTDVTVIIPTHRRVPFGLNAWKKQCANIWVLRNGPVVLDDSEVTVVDCDWLGHGGTRQSVIAKVDTPYVYFTVDDAIPLANVLGPLIESISDSNNAAISRQIPYPIADPMTRHLLHTWTPYSDEPYLVSQTDHVGTLYRTQDLKDHPIPAVPIAEDACWSLGKSIVCDPRSVMVHSHPRQMRSLVEREFKIHRQLTKINRSVKLGFTEAILGGISQTPLYGFQEGVRTVAQNLARFAAQRL